MKRNIILLALAMTLIFAMPVLAVEGEVTTGVEMEDVTDSPDVGTLTYADGTLDFSALMADDFAADTSFLIDAPLENPGNMDIYLGQTLEFTGVDYLATGVEGGLEDDYMLAILDAEEDAKIFANLYANVEVDDMVDNLAFGANNNLEFRNVEDDDDNPWLNPTDVELENYLTLNPFANYEMEVNEEFTVGANNDLELGLLENEVDGDMAKVLTSEPFANYEMEVVPDVTAGVNNTLTVELLDEESEELEFNPFLGVDMELDADTTFVADINHTLTRDGFTDAAHNDDIVVESTLENTAVENLALGVTGALDDDELLIIEDVLTNNNEFNTSFAAELYANYAMDVTEELEVGSDNNVTFGDEEGLGVAPFADYTMNLDDNLCFNARTDIDLVTGDFDDVEVFDGVSIEASVTYTF